MSRSIIHTKAIKKHKSMSDKKDRQQANKKFRRLCKSLLNNKNFDDNSYINLNIKEVSDIWGFNSDGGARYDKDLGDKDMRK